MTKPFDVTAEEFSDRVLNSEDPVVVDFWAEWCGACLMMAPVLEELAGELADSASFAKLNVDDNPEVSHQYGVGGIPTLVVFKDGEEKGRLVGFAPKPELRREIEDILVNRPGIHAHAHSHSHT